jgi:hypothetical protein
MAPLMPWKLGFGIADCGLWILDLEFGIWNLGFGIWDCSVVSSVVSGQLPKISGQDNFQIPIPKSQIPNPYFQFPI